ncbi:MAG: hypothetical protein JW768_11125 [Chitinispirillaceae bacterium]|nr:hypothetical protein [Chitinispirillaceae bacterium]
MNSKIILCIAFFCMTMAVSAKDGVVKIGSRVYDESAITAAMKTFNATDPFIAVQALKRQAMAEQLAAKRNLEMNDPEKSLYLAVAGEDLDKDRSIKNTPDIPLTIKKPADIRVGLFEKWLTNLAEKNIPVYVLNHDKLWEIFIQSDSYKIRAEHGHVLKPGHDTYTWADLSVGPTEILATRKGEPFITGDEFNAYLKKNASALNLLGKRSKEPSQAKMDIVRLIAAGNLLAEEAKRNNARLTDMEIERSVSRLVRENMINENFDINGLQAQTLSDYMEILNRRSLENCTIKVGTLRAVLKGDAQCAESDYETKTSVMHAAYSYSESRIMNSLQDGEVYEWMKEKKFKGSLKEARMMLTQERQQKHIDDLVAAEEVVFNIK